MKTILMVKIKKKKRIKCFNGPVQCKYIHIYNYNYVSNFFLKKGEVIYEKKFINETNN